jgi:hypothetical protein
MKSTQATVQRRVSEVLTIRLQGAEFHDIVQYAAEKKWRVGERQLWNYIRQADELLAQNLEKDREKLFNRHVASRQMLLARALQVSDLRTALAILKDKAELEGLYPPKRTELTGKDGDAMQLEVWNDDDLSEAAAGLFARAGVGKGGPAEALPAPGQADRPALGTPRQPLPPGCDGAGPLAGDVTPLDF